MYRCELDNNDYLTSFCSKDGVMTYEKYIDLEELPTYDFIKIKAYHKISETEVELDEVKYQELLKEQEQNQKNMEIQMEINKLKNELSQSDYKIIKTYEDSLVGLPSDYDIDELHKERQSYRDKINELESQLGGK